jgi:hypothetical protein
MNDIDTLNDTLFEIQNRLAALEAAVYATEEDDSDDLDEEIDEDEDFDDEDDNDEESDDQESDDQE